MTKIAIPAFVIVACREPRIEIVDVGAHEWVVASADTIRPPAQLGVLEFAEEGVCREEAERY
jgi:hypothetical protein